MVKFLVLIAGALFAANVWLVQRVLRPLKRLAHTAEKVSSGELTAFEAQCGGIDEVETVRRSMVAMAGHVQRAQQQSRAYTDALSDGQEEERARIARELHDDTVQSLIAIAQRIDVVLATLEPDAKARAMLESARQQSTDAVVALRRLIGDLRPPALDELGLPPALRMLAQQSTEPRVSLTVDGVERRLEPGIELALYRSAAEALQNARRHAQASKIDVLLTFRNDYAQVTIKDDGVGFRWPLQTDDVLENRHFGLLGMAERLQRFSGSLQVRSQPAQGTQIDIRVPTVAVPLPANQVRDPVCSALLAPEQAYGSVEHRGERYYFCCPICQGTFQRDPDAYANPQPLR
jgi:two-component system sensor histidine kinase UhpB